jgi:hypothetical protein
MRRHELFCEFIEKKGYVYIMLVLFLFMVFDVYTPMTTYYSIYFKERPDGLFDPTFEEAYLFMRINQIDKREYSSSYNCVSFSWDTIDAAAEIGMKSYFVIIQKHGHAETHAIIGFNTTDLGFCYFEPQTDELLNESEFRILDVLTYGASAGFATFGVEKGDPH